MASRIQPQLILSAKGVASPKFQDHRPFTFQAKAGVQKLERRVRTQHPFMPRIMVGVGVRNKGSVSNPVRIQPQIEFRDVDALLVLQLERDGL
jgi:hypothetical protein